MKQYDPLPAAPAFRIKGSAITATVLELANPQADALEHELADAVTRSPELLRHAPLLIALDRLGDNDGPLDLAALLATCRHLELHPVGLRAHRADDLAQAERLGIAVLPPARARERSPEAANDVGENAGAPAAAKARASRVVTQPVRGGQQIYAEGDLILLAPVSAGAEVMADGNIHVYAALRGRALAGVQGDTSARIFCRELAAELVAIAGHYRIADDLRHEALWQQSVQIALDGEELKLAAL